MNQDVKKFYEKMSKDKVLQEESNKILKDIDSKNLSQQDRDDAYDSRMLALAREHGYHFTLAEAKEVNEKIAAHFSELSDEDLEQVAGGVTIPSIIPGIAAYGVMPHFPYLNFDWRNLW